MNFNKIFEEFPNIETNKIRLRKLCDEDATDLYHYYSNKNVHQFLDWYGPDSIESSQRIIQIWNKGYTDGWIIRFGITERKTDRIIGTIFLNGFEGKRAEIGYELSEDHWKKGIMTDAIKSVLSLGFNRLGLERIQAFVCEENQASKNILTKYNFKEEGYLRQYECHNVTSECRGMYIYGLLKKDFKQ